MTTVVGFPPSFLPTIHSAVEYLRDFGVESDSMHGVINRVESLFFRTQSEAKLACSRLVADLSQISKKCGINIVETKIPGLMREALQTMYPGSVIDDSFLGSFLLDERTPFQSPLSSVGAPGCRTVGRPYKVRPLDSSLEHFSVERVSSPPPISKRLMPDSFPEIPCNEDLLEVARVIEGWSSVIERIGAPLASSDRKESNVQKRMAEILYRHGNNCLRELRALLDELKKEKGQVSEGCSYSMAPQPSMTETQTQTEGKGAAAGSLRASDFPLDFEGFQLDEEIVEQEPRGQRRGGSSLPSRSSTPSDGESKEDFEF